MNQDIPGMYRDARGIVYHPHTREVIQLGTLQVEAYARPRLTFNKILYCEKEGLFPTLLSVRFPERFDCALMTSKGYASRAARDLLDRLAGTEDLQIFCIHDADAAGTMIYQSLQKATVARPGRKVEIIDLGLSPQEAIEMGLEIEPVQIAGRKRQAVATGISEELTEWLQENRVELNAMPAPMLVEWLEKKMAPYIGKVVPPADVLREQLKQDVHKKLEERLKEEALRRANIPAQLALELEKRRASLEEVSLSLEEQVGRHLANHAPDLWTKPVAQIADVIAGKITPEPDSRLAG